MFDPNQYLDTSITESNERRPPLPVDNPDSADGLYTALIGEIEPKSGRKAGKDGVERDWLQMAVPLEIDVPQSLQDALKLPKSLKLTDRVFIDLTDSGLIDNAPGRNRGQKAYRDATGQNVPGQPFAWRSLTGRQVKIKIGHEEYPEGSGVMQERIAAISKA